MDRDDTLIECPACGGDTRRECDLCDGAGVVSPVVAARWCFQKARRIFTTGQLRSLGVERPPLPGEPRARPDDDDKGRG